MCRHFKKLSLHILCLRRSRLQHQKRIKNAFLRGWDSIEEWDPIRYFVHGLELLFLTPFKHYFESAFFQVSEVNAESIKNLEKERFMLKETLTRYITVSLVGNPNLEKPGDAKRIKILELCEKVAEFDPEFILKLVLYCRQDLNVRSTSHLLLAFASLHKPCRPFLRR